MSRIVNHLKRSIYYRATLLFPSFFRKRFFDGLHKGLTRADQVDLLPEKELLVLYFLLPENNVAVDVGANNGAYSYFFKTLTGSARVLAFEPLPGLFRKLKTWFNDISLFNLALSNENGQATIRIPVIGDRLFESRAKLDNLTEENQSGLRELSIQTARLDDVLNNQALERLDIIKIDIEGHELKAIEGARKSITKFHPWLLVEIESRHHGGTVDKAVAEICTLGYEVWFFDFFNRRLKPMSEYRLTEMQDRAKQNTFAYINNFLFMPTGKNAEIARVNEELAVFLKNSER